MFQSLQIDGKPLAEWLRTEAGRRLLAIGLALLFELLLLLLLLTLDRHSAIGVEDAPLISTFDAGEVEDAPEPEKPAPQPEAAARPQAQPQPTPPDQPAPPQPATLPPTALPRQAGPTVDITQLPRTPARPAPAQGPVGPPAPSTRNDTAIVGRRPNGQPVYAAQWYREPSDQEMRGYLSTAQGPGWGLIECKTVPDFRVENCEFVNEYPQGSFIARAGLAAAWQFRVRPPRRGNSYLVGEWVRIRIILNPASAGP